MPIPDQGVSRDRYAVIPRTLIFLTRGNTVLLLKGAADKRLWANRYNGVGGHIERAEDVLGAARRELREETGLQAHPLWLCGLVLVDTEDPSTGICLFILRGELPVGEVIPSEEGDLKWVPFDEVMGLPLVEDLRVLLPRILAMQPGDPPFSALLSYKPEQELFIQFG